MDELSVTTAQRLMQPDTGHSHPSGPSSSTEETLWVDRYRPKRYTDLLGDERVHREVLAWVKQWDLCVFGKGRGKKRAREGDEFASLEDESGRPLEKVGFFLRKLSVLAKVDDRYYCCLALLAWERRPLRTSLLPKQGTVSSKLTPGRHLA